jgi:hypothetical protein
MSAEYAFWNAALAAKQAGRPIPETPIKGRVESGFYRTGSGKPVSIWRDAGTLFVQVGTQLIEKPEAEIAESMFSFWCSDPVSYDAWEAVCERGEPWPDQHEAVRDVEQMASPFASAYSAISGDLQALGDPVSELVKAGAAQTEDASNRAADLAGKLQDLEKRAESERKAEKQPHMDAAKAVDERWKPLIEAASANKSLIKSRVVEPWLKAKADAERKARDEAARLAREEAERSGAGQAEAAAAAAMASQPVKASTKGGRVALRTYEVITITDIRAVLRFFVERNEEVPKLLIEPIEQLAKAMHRAGVKIPGITITTEQKAA